MTDLVITGWSALSGTVTTGTAQPGSDVASLLQGPLPAAQRASLVTFDVREQLGRKGTSFYDRVTALAVVACDIALREAGVAIDELGRDRVGVVLGTTVGSFKSTSDFCRETLVQEKPYLVNPVLFPNTVMNCAAGQAAIRLGLRGVNATIAGGRLAFHHALRYATNALHRRAADVMVVGGAEEFSPHRAWSAYRGNGPDGTGEGAAVFVLERADAPRTGRPVADLLGIAAGFGWRDAATVALAGCVSRALAAAECDESRISLVATGDLDTGAGSEYATVVRALGTEPEHLAVGAELGECDAATGALGLAAVLTRFAADPDAAAMLTARTRDGGVAAAVVGGTRCPR